eukprot:14491233-Alexandrium_andersonii.AAC.1
MLVTARRLQIRNLASRDPARRYRSCRATLVCPVPAVTTSRPRKQFTGQQHTRARNSEVSN